MTDPGAGFTRSRRSTTTVIGVLLAALILAVGGVTVSSLAASPRAAKNSALGFSHAVVVDQQRPGFEPDVKVDANGNIYTSVPFGFSTTQSFVWSSRDHGNSYQFVPGNVGPGKPTTCVGGGDTDLFLDPGTPCTSPTCRA